MSRCQETRQSQEHALGARLRAARTPALGGAASDHGVDRRHDRDQKQLRLDVAADAAVCGTVAHGAENKRPAASNDAAQESDGVRRKREVRLLGTQQPDESGVVAE